MNDVTRDPRPVLVAAVALVLAFAAGGLADAKPKKKLPRNSVGTAQLKSAAVTQAKVAVGAIATPQIAAAAVAAGEIARGAVGTSEIADGAVGIADLAAASVGVAQIVNGAVGSAQIADGAVGSADMADGAVGSAKIADGAVGSAKIANGAVGSAAIADGSVGAAELAPGTLPSQDVYLNAPASATAIGVSPTEVAELTGLPGGDYEIQAKLWLNTPSADPVVTCELVSGETVLDRVESDASVSEQAPMFLLAAAQVSADVELECTGTIAGSSATDAKLLASQTGSITVQP